MNVCTTAFAEFAGILLGDGHIASYITNHTNNRVQVTNIIKITLDSREEQYAQYVKDLMTGLFGKTPKLEKRDGENTVDIRFSGLNNVQFLQSIGFVLAPKWKRAIIPPCFLRPELELFVIRGYFDTDGSVVITNNNGTIYPRLEMKVSPSPMQPQFIEILRRHNFHFGVYQIGKGKIRIQLNGKEPLKKWYKEIGFSNHRHLEKAKKFL
ncbi:LAGLIDADG-like domain protein [uncultured archaeon]|nr:LAGLIDADG-like domain protein [uncultured archaeon]